MAAIEVPDPKADARIAAALREDGYAVLALPPDVDPSSSRALAILEDRLAAVGRPIQVFGEHPAWRPIGVRLDREATRSEGAGESPIHMDFVNAEDPPDIVMLYCERPDSLGGGHNLLAPVRTAERLPEDMRERLGRRVYADGHVKDLHNVGRDINPFAVIADHGRWRFRYTGRLLSNEAISAEERAALRALDRALRHAATRLCLTAGQALVLDQHRIAHSRLPLGKEQHRVPPNRRRLLWQRFARAKDV
ncbi:TauD/TfdA family dioxygenase [Microbispora sp. ZYX-F-249]|uniref:TauD/TfdA family dioxygenase n=1 Tax=Microbispora maris TaxID=3144104 RepID=A0ABV0APL1_9ACTN